jgi:hypothetical protein
MFSLRHLGWRCLDSLRRARAAGRDALLAVSSRRLGEWGSLDPEEERPPAPAYHPATHYSLGQASPRTVRRGGSTVLVYQVKVMWTADRDGRMRGLEELNLSHLDGRVIAVHPEPSRGSWQHALLTLGGGPPHHRFFPKD